MKAIRLCVPLTLALIPAGCGGAEGPGTEPPAGVAEPDVTVVGSTTTIANADVPLWGGPGRLVEEASIGSATGDEAYLLGGVTSMAASEDRIYVVDFQAIKVRTYDLQGNHLSDIGTEGSGPGEFRRPWDVGVRDDGRLLVRDQNQRRLHVFTPDGELVDDWPIDRGHRASIAQNGAVYMILEQFFPSEDGEVVIQVKRHDPDGTAHDWERFPVLEPTPLIDSGNQLELMAQFVGVNGDWRSTRWIPFSPRAVAEIAADGSMVWGYARDYQFEIRRPDGTSMVVQKAWSPVPVAADEAAWYRAKQIALWRAATDESWTWVGGDIPADKPPYLTIVPGRRGRIWVIRALAGERIPGCSNQPDDYYGYVESPCWRQPYEADVFDEEGRFLGPVPMPDGIQYHVRPYIRGDMILGLVEDSNGVFFVKRYRLEVSGP